MVLSPSVLRVTQQKLEIAYPKTGLTKFRKNYAASRGSSWAHLSFIIISSYGGKVPFEKLQDVTGGPFH